MGEYYKIVTEEDHLEHYGVKGMKWDLKFRKHNDSYYDKKKRRSAFPGGISEEYRKELEYNSKQNIYPSHSNIIQAPRTSIKGAGEALNSLSKNIEKSTRIRKISRQALNTGKKMGPIILRSIGQAVVRTNPAVRGAKKND